MAWPGYPSKEMVTDGDKNISIIAAQPTYSQVRGQIRSVHWAKSKLAKDARNVKYIRVK
jgi:hypothetical protein